MPQGGLAKFGGRAAVGLAEGGAEVAVTGKTEIETQGGEIAILREKVERASETEAQLITIERETFYLLENLCEVDGRAVNFRGDLGQRPTARQIAGEHELHAVDQALAAKSGAGRMRRAWTKRALHESESETLCFERFRDAVTQTVAEKCDERLRAGVNAQALPPERERPTFVQQSARSELG